MRKGSVTMEKPFSQACENNKRPILTVLQRVLDQSHRLLEIGSGTGQHAVFFAAEMPHLIWQPSELEKNIAAVNSWCGAVPAPNLKSPVELNIQDTQWPVTDFDAVFSANTAHIMDVDSALLMVKRIAEYLPTGGVFALYGPFNYGGLFTSESNAQFDEWLKQQNSSQGIRQFEDLNAVAEANGLSLFEDNGMPANNRLLVWVKQPVIVEQLTTV